jgi:hypothetical protein
VKKRIGDRRRRPRFEIVGTLTGTLEVWQRFRLLNLGAGGALIESMTPMLPGSRVNGRVSICGQLRDVRAVIRRVTPDSGRRYKVAVEWGNALPENDMLLAADQVPSRRRSFRQSGERRRTIRVTPTKSPEIRWPAFSTVQLVDISTDGVLFNSPVPLTAGEKAQLRMRLGDRSFSGEIEIRREHTKSAKQSGYPFAAVFTSVGEASRLTLDEFLGDQRT